MPIIYTTVSWVLLHDDGDSTRVLGLLAGGEAAELTIARIITDRAAKSGMDFAPGVTQYGKRWGIDNYEHLSVPLLLDGGKTGEHYVCDLHHYVD